MVIRVFLLIALALATIPVFTFELSLVSTPNTLVVVLGVCALLTTAYAWVRIGSLYIRYFQRKAVQDEIEKLFGVDSGR